MTNNSTIVPEMGSGKRADALAKDPDESASWTADAESVPELPGADVASLSRYKEEIDSQIAELDATMKEAEARVAELQQKLASMARYSTDREVAANRLEAGAGTGEYEAMRQRESSDAEKEATEKKAAEDASKVSEIEKQYKIAEAKATLNTDEKNLNDARTTVNTQDSSASDAVKKNNSDALVFATSQFENDLKKAGLTGLSADELAPYMAILKSTSLTPKTPPKDTADDTSVDKEGIHGLVEQGRSVKSGDHKDIQKAERARLGKLLPLIKASGMSPDDKNTATNEVNHRIAEILAYPTAESIAKKKTDAEQNAAAEKAQASRDINAWISAKRNPRDYSGLKNDLASFLRQHSNVGKYYNIGIDSDGKFYHDPKPKPEGK